MANTGVHRKVRIDKWLWAARFFKTRSLAAKAVSGGKVQVNGRRVTPSATVQMGDHVKVRKGMFEHHVILRRLTDQRRPAREAATLYEETLESVRAREEVATKLKAMPRFAFGEKGRPTKKQRRRLDQLRGYNKD